MSVDGAKIYFVLPVLGGIPVTQTMLSSFLVMLLLCIAGYRLGRNLTKRPGSVQVLTEKAVSSLYNLVSDTMGAHNAHWTPYIGALFLSSLFGSLIGMTGFLRSTTADLSTTLTWALMTSALIWYHSIKNRGFLGWLKGFTEPIVVMTPKNLVSEIAQPISMAFRHFGNVVGGTVITTMLYTALSGASAALLNLLASSGLAVCVVLMAAGVGLTLWGFRKKKLVWKILGIALTAIATLALLQLLGVVEGVPILGLGLPAILSLYFDIFSGFIQAFVFCLLSMVYISSACPPPAGEGEEAAP